MLTRIKQLMQQKVFKNISWMMFERIFQMVVSVIIGMISARYLGPQNYGLISYGLSFVTLFTAFSKLGLDSIIVNEFIKNKDKEGKILGTSIFMRVISSVLSVILIYITVLILKPNDNITQIIVILQSLSLICQSFDLIDNWFQSKLKSKYIAISKAIAYIIVAIYKIYLLVTMKSVIWFAFTTTLEYLILVPLYIKMYKKNNGLKMSISIETGKTLIKKSYHFIFSALIVSIYMQMDKIMLGSYLGDYYVGLYAVTTTICGYWGIIPDSIINSFRSLIFEKKTSGNEQMYLNTLKRLYRIIFWICVAFSIGMLIFSKLIIIILYGKEYIGASRCLFIYSLSVIFAYLGTARGIWIVAEEKNKYVKYYILMGGIINLILNALLIPTFGIDGAAIATVITQIFVAIFAPLLFKETKESTKYIIQGILIKKRCEGQK